VGSLWYVIVVISIFYLAWRAVVLEPPTVKEQRQGKYHYVRAGIFSTAGQLLFMFVLYTTNLTIGSLLPLLCFLTWTTTVGLILLNSTAPRFLRRTSIVVVTSAPLILFLYTGGVRQFLGDVDSFSTVVARGLTAAKSTNPDNHLQTGQINTRDAAPVDPREGDAAGNKIEHNPLPDIPTTISQVRLSHVLKAIFFFVHVFLLTQYLGTMWYFGYQEKSKLAAKSALEQDAANQIVLVISMAFSFWLAFVLLGFDTLSVSVFSGLVVIGASVALKDLLSNFISGALLLWLKSIRVGDVISINKSGVGRVVGITMRYLIVEDRNDIEYLIPYSQLASATVENWSKGKQQVRLKLNMSVAYGSPIDKVKDIMSSVCFEVPRVLSDPLPAVLIMDTGDSAIQLQLRFRIADPENGISNVKSDVFEKLLKRFAAAKIEIPYPQREIRIRSNEPSSLNGRNHQ
jgi:small-conductance mechanosensitive channel